MAERIILWTITDPRGLHVTLTRDVWLAVLAKHPELTEFVESIATTIQEPDGIYFDSESTSERTTGAKFFVYYRSGLFKGNLAGKFSAVVVKVLIEQAEEQGFVQTAYPAEHILPRVVLEWKK